MNQLDQFAHLTKKSLLCSLLGLAGLALNSPPGHAQEPSWPERPIKLMVGYPPGGGTDTVARILAEQLTKRMGESVVVENRPGASGMIATLAVARSKPDGYSLIFATGASLTAPAVSAQINGREFDSLRDLQPITFIGGGPYILIANKDFPPNTLAELVAYAKKHPDSVNYASPGKETFNYLLLEGFNIDAGIQTTHVPYKGSSELMHNLVAGYVQYTLETPGTTLPLIQEGKVKTIALLSEKRLPKLNSVPTAVEQRYPSLVGGSWYGVLAPAGTPEDVVRKLNAEIVAVLKTPEVMEIFDKREITVAGSSPTEFTDFIKSEMLKRKTIVEKINKAATNNEATPK